MSVESCGVDASEDTYEGLVGFAREVSWNGHTVTVEDGLDVPFIKKFVPMEKYVGGSVKAEKDPEGKTSATAEGHFTAKDDKGGQVSVSAAAGVRRDAEGKVSTEAKVTFSADKSFRRA
jgi:hypothetical protein